MDIKGFKDTIQWYDDNAEQYSKVQSSILPIDSIEWFLAALPAHPHILEAGCGPGRESKAFIEKGATIVGVDLSANLIKIAKRNNPTGEYIVANFLDVPVTSGLFDAVWAHAALVHLETEDDVRKALAEFYRVLKPGGVLYIYVKMQRGSEKTAVVSDSLSKHDRFFRYYAEDELKELLSNAGFSLMEMHLKDDGHGRTEVTWIELMARKPA